MHLYRGLVELPCRYSLSPASAAATIRQQLVDAVEELCLEGTGDILIFQSGEREIRDTAEGLAVKTEDTHISPLFARMPHAQ